MYFSLKYKNDKILDFSVQPERENVDTNVKKVRINP